MITSETLYLLLPELLLIVLATLLYVVGAFVAARAGWGIVAVVILVLSGSALLQQQLSYADGELATAANAAVLIDTFSMVARWFILAVGLLLVMMSARGAHGRLCAETMGTLLLLVAGMMIIVCAADLALLFLGLELVSIPTYVLLYLSRKDQESQESATKYFFLSILSSAILLYGMTFLYGATGSIKLEGIRQVLLAQPNGPLFPLAKVALVLLFAGLGFRLTAVPFHFYAADVYQGQSNTNAGLLSVVPKIAGLTALVRLLIAAMPGIEGSACNLLLVVAILTMTLGNVLALWQTKVRRMLAYSSIAQGGYLLVGLAAHFAAGHDPAAVQYSALGAVFFYLAIYTFTTLGLFAGFTYLSAGKKGIDTVDDLAGVGRTYPLIGLALAVFLFGLTGIPPMAGFWGKLTLIFTALGVGENPIAGISGTPQLALWFKVLAVITVLNAAISAGYYLRLIGAMYFRGTHTTLHPAGWELRAATVVCLAVLVVMSACPGMFLEIAQKAAGTLSSANVAQRESEPASNLKPVLAVQESGGLAE